MLFVSGGGFDRSCEHSVEDIKEVKEIIVIIRRGYVKKQVRTAVSEKQLF